VQNCAPYLCQPNGNCGTTCGTTSDCASGYNCDPTTKSCVQTQAQATNSNGGCGVTAAPRTGSGLALVFAALGALAIARRRRES
jgi:MYXO-CTERM domain-containing protein